MMQPIVETFAERVGRTTLNPPRLPFLSNVTGTWITAEQATSPTYWAHHLRQTVRFSDCLRTLMQEPNRVLLEVGPGRTLCTLAKRHPSRAAGHVVLSSIRHPKEQVSDEAFLLDAVGQLWLAGMRIDWHAVHNGSGRRVPLPTYPFERKHYWITSGRRICTAPSAGPVEEAGTEEPGGSMNVQTSRDDSDGFIGSEEHLIAGIWQECLGTNKVDVGDNFFDLGGNSLVAVRVVAQIRRTFGVHLAVSCLFENPTVGALAEAVRKAGRGRAGSSDEENQDAHLAAVAQKLGIM